jgi:hypothetical protein
MRKPKDARHLKFAIGGDEPDPIEMPVRHKGKKKIYRGLDGKPRDNRTGRLLAKAAPNEGGPSMTTWLVIGGAVALAGLAAWYFTRPKTAAAATPGVLPVQATKAAAVIGPDGLSILPPAPGTTTRSIPVGTPCAAAREAILAARTAGDVNTFAAAVAAWNANCLGYTLGV